MVVVIVGVALVMGCGASNGEAIEVGAAGAGFEVMEVDSTGVRAGS